MFTIHMCLVRDIRMCVCVEEGQCLNPSISLGGGANENLYFPTNFIENS
jgi:hypothetical protein